MKKSIVLLILFALFYSSSISVQACIEDVPLKDRGPIRMLCDMTLDNQSCLYDDIDGDYSVDISSIRMINDEAIRIWNEMSIIYFDETSVRIPILNLHIFDGELEGYSVAQTNFALNTIVLDEVYYASMTEDQRIKTLLHELGHVLGMNEFNSSGNDDIIYSENSNNVMVQGVRSLTDLGPCDKYMYYWIWE